MVLHCVQLPAELFQCCLASHRSKLIIFERSLADVFWHDRTVGLAEFSVVLWCRTSEKFLHEARL